MAKKFQIFQEFSEVMAKNFQIFSGIAPKKWPVVLAPSAK